MHKKILMLLITYSIYMCPLVHVCYFLMFLLKSVFLFMSNNAVIINWILVPCVMWVLQCVEPGNIPLIGLISGNT